MDNKRKLEFIETGFKGLTIIKRKPIEDERGFFERSFCKKELSSFINDEEIVQCNHSHTRIKGSIRGMHYQTAPFSEIKIVNCIKGAILDVVIDLRRESETFLKYYQIELSEENRNSLMIPAGFAHGFQTLQDSCELLYMHTQEFNAVHEAGINPFDSQIGIKWPLEVKTISKRDRSLPLLNEKFQGIKV